MTSQLSSGDLISDRYATALYEFATESKSVDLVLKDFDLLKKYIEENKDLNLLVKSPLITSKDKLKIFEKLLSKEPAKNITFTFLKVIANNRRISKLPSIIFQFFKINAQKRGDVLADIISAEELSNEQKNDIENQLKSILGNKISLNYKVNKKIIGGLIVKVGSKMIDSSLASKINKIKIAIKGT